MSPFGSWWAVSVTFQSLSTVLYWGEGEWKVRKEVFLGKGEWEGYGLETGGAGKVWGAERGEKEKREWNLEIFIAVFHWLVNFVRPCHVLRKKRKEEGR